MYRLCSANGNEFSVPRVRLTHVPRPMQLAQAAAKGLDFLLVCDLLAFGQFQGLQHVLHFGKRRAECLDDLIDFFDGLRDCQWGGRAELAGWARRRRWFVLDWGTPGRATFTPCASELFFPGGGGLATGLVRELFDNFWWGNPRRRRARESFRAGLFGVGSLVRRRGWLLCRGFGGMPASSATTASAPPPASRTLRSRRRLRRYASCIRCWFGIHRCFNLP